MKRFLLIIIGSYIVILGVLLGVVLLFSLFSLETDFIILPLNFSPLLLVIAFLPFTVWFLLTGIGLILKKSLARYSLIVMSYFMFFIGLVTFLTFFLLPEPEGILFLYREPKIIVLTAVMIFLMILPLFFIFFLNSKTVKNIFTSKQIKLEVKKPLGIKIISGFSLLVALFFIFYGSFPYYEIPVTNSILLSGTMLTIYSLVIAFLNLYIAISLMKLQRISWIITILYHSFASMILTLNILTVSNNTLFKIANKIPETLPAVFIISYRIGSILSLIFSIIILIYITSRKKFFFRASKD